jgi:hypothetical protein
MLRTIIAGRAGLALACAILVMPACGGGSDTPNTPTPVTTPPPPPPAPTVVRQGAGPIPAETVGFVDFTTTLPGRLDVTVDWTFATNDVDIFIVRGSCTDDQLRNDTCPFLAMATSETAKPERLSVPNAAAGLYTLYVANFGSSDESVAFQAVLTPNASNLSAAQSASTAARVELKGPVLGIRELR